MRVPPTKNDLDRLGDPLTASLDSNIIHPVELICLHATGQQRIECHVDRTAAGVEQTSIARFIYGFSTIAPADFPDSSASCAWATSDRA